MKITLAILCLVAAPHARSASVFFSQAVDGSGTPTGGLSGVASLPVFAPIRETAGSAILGYAEVTVGAGNGQVAGFPISDGTDTYIYQQVAGGGSSSTSLNFRFVGSDGSGVPLPGITVGVSELFIRVDGRPLTTGGGYVTPEELNTLTLTSTGTPTWEVVNDLAIVDDTINDGVLSYTVSSTLSTPSQYIQWRAYDSVGAESITGFTWQLDNDGGALNATHLQLDLAPIPVPEPSGLLLAGAGIAAAGLRRRSRGA